MGGVEWAWQGWCGVHGDSASARDGLVARPLASHLHGIRVSAEAIFAPLPPAHRAATTPKWTCVTSPCWSRASPPHTSSRRLQTALAQPAHRFASAGRSSASDCSGVCADGSRLVQGDRAWRSAGAMRAAEWAVSSRSRTRRAAVGRLCSPCRAASRTSRRASCACR